jgi:molybdate transport system ATP-binding protein
MTLSVAIEHEQGAFRLDAAFDCGPGVTALFGRSGSGKTTLVNAIAGLLRPRKGQIVFDGEPLFDSVQDINVPARERRFGYVFQEGRLFPHLTVRQNLLFSRLFDRRPHEPGQLDHIVSLLGLEGLLARRPAQLSGGEKQRVAIGRALLATPRLLLLDEPLASLDIHRKTEVLRYVELLRDEVRIPIIYVSHAVEEVVRLAGTMVLVSDGRVIAAGPVEQVMTDLELRPYTGRYEGGAVIAARVVGQDGRYGLARLAFDGGELFVADLDALPGESVRIRIRARDVALALEAPHATTFRNVVRGRIGRIVESDGPMAEVRVEVGNTAIVARVTRQSLHELDLREGMTVYALIKAIALDRHSVGYA